MISKKIIAEGEKFTICEIEQDGTSTLKNFFKTLTEEQQAAISSAIKFIVDNGPPHRKTKFSPEGGQIYAIKENGIRIYCFFDRESQIVLTNGVIKKKRKADPNDLKRAKTLRKACLRRKL
ncbi:MAG: type II toxin-antitoxin system RelE/ParE family toxin [Syntrophobacteraceae bacterium]|jgi:mRNA-degrading endonuclease RelE of RelBE toxin-antitoxin system